MDLLDLYERGSAWTAEKVAGACKTLDQETPCDDWRVRDLINHLLQGNRMFQGAARGEPAAPPASPPPDLVGDDPVGDYEQSRNDTIAAFKEEGALEKAGRTLGIAFVDHLVHGWDLAKATGQDATMPADLAETAFSMVEGRLPEDRGGFFKPAVEVPDDASAQDKLLAYSGRQP